MTNTDCPVGYDVQGEALRSCYKGWKDAKSWLDAQNHCLSQGGHLVSVESEKENTFLVDKLKNHWRKYYIMLFQNMWLWFTYILSTSQKPYYIIDYAGNAKLFCDTQIIFFLHFLSTTFNSLNLR